jgi:type VI secretion system secreted protein VgrG
MSVAALSIATIGGTVHAGIVASVPLATAGSYSVLAGTTVTNTGPSVLAESIGLHPGTAVEGFPPGTVLPPGTTDAGGPTSLIAQNDLTIAYDNAAGRSVEFTQTNPDLVGQTLIPGVYAASAKAPLSLSGQLVLDGQNNASAVFIFQTDSTLITSSGSSILLINGASECNVFWQVGSSATLGSGSVFVGNILALTTITIDSGVTVHGKALARNGEVTLINDTFIAPSCVPAASPTTAPAAVASPGGDIPATGGTTTLTAAVAIALVAIGVGAVLISRRRTRA